MVYPSNLPGSPGSTGLPGLKSPLSEHASELARALTQSTGGEDHPHAKPAASGTGGDSFTLSKEGLEALSAEVGHGPATEGESGAPHELSPEDKEEVRRLEARDREVRTHEEAHKAAAGGLASSGPTYEYETGPDGKRYAVGGEVGIRMAEGRTPEETLANAQRIQAAALAPASPSAQDRSVAAQAKLMEAEARQEIAAERAEAADEAGELDDGTRGTVGILPPDLFA